MAAAAAVAVPAKAGVPDVHMLFHELTSTCTYIVSDPVSKEAVIIDSVLDFDISSGVANHKHSEKIIEYVKEASLTVKYIMETHVHADHLTGAKRLKTEYPEALTSIGMNVTAVQAVFKKTFNLGEEFSPDGSQFDKLWADGEEWTLGELSCYVLHTPGHTPACMTYVIGDAAFSGDTVFMPDFGSARCDFPGGDAETLFTSVTDKLYGLPDGTRLFVGHDYKPGGRDLKWETTVAEEKSTNKHMNMSTEKGEFIAWREGRDTTLNAPKLLLPSLQVNLRNGSMPPAEANGVSYLKMPVSYCCGAVDEAH